eukprot:351800-Chlamydomonas_euryale.AAC.4
MNRRQVGGRLRMEGEGGKGWAVADGWRGRGEGGEGGKDGRVRLDGGEGLCARGQGNAVRRLAARLRAAVLAVRQRADSAVPSTTQAAGLRIAEARRAEAFLAWPERFQATLQFRTVWQRHLAKQTIFSWPLTWPSDRSARLPASTAQPNRPTKPPSQNPPDQTAQLNRLTRLPGRAARPDCAAEPPDQIAQPNGRPDRPAKAPNQTAQPKCLTRLQNRTT